MRAPRPVLAFAIVCCSGVAFAQAEPPAPPAAAPDASAAAPDASAASPDAATSPAEPPAAAAAASPAAARVDAARRLGTQGLTAYDARAYVTAIERLTSALHLHEAPTLRLYRARAFGKLGRWVAACEDYDAILRSRAALGESPVVVQARDAATEEGKEACVRIAKLRLVDVANDGGLEVRLDGAVLPSEQLDRVRYLDPGPHGLERSQAGRGSMSRVLSLAAGEIVTVSLRSLEPVDHASVDGELLRFLAERPRSAAGERRAAPSNVRDAAPLEGAREGALEDTSRPSETFRLEASPLGTMYHQVNYSARALSTDADTSTALVARLALEWYPLPEGLRDWVGVGATWVQGFATSDFDYSESLAVLMSRYSVGRWRFGAKLGVGFIVAGGQRFAPLEPSLDAGVRFGDFSVTVAGTFIAPIGDVTHTIYTDLSGYGLDGRLALAYRVWRALELQLSLASRRYAFDLDSPDAAITLAGGAPPPRSSSMVDRYTIGAIGISMSL